MNDAIMLYLSIAWEVGTYVFSKLQKQKQKKKKGKKNQYLTVLSNIVVTEPLHPHIFVVGYL
jgi:hypothetical protein